MMGIKTIAQSVELTTISVILNKANQIRALLDSGAMNNFIHQDIVKKLGLKMMNRKEPQLVKDIQGGSLGWTNKVCKATIEIGRHQEEMVFSIIPLGKHDLVIRLSWLQKHNPIIRWSEKKIQISSPFCKKNCLTKEKKPRNKQGQFV